ncbi:MAG: hypothetical protein J0H63_09315 [Rhizobiales bacterium]|nr:hypothetical protein [Hyphomicrobiales bacterium]
MAEHIDGPLYYERMGRSGPVMAFVHPNPMDQSAWIYQLAQMSTWYRCIAIDVPEEGDFGAGLGAARLGLVAAEGADPFAVCTQPKIIETIEPDRSLVPAYAESYATYRRLYPAIKEAMKS